MINIEESLELNQDQLARNDEIYNAALDFCKVLTENEDLEYDMSFLGEIADFAANILYLRGHRVRFPSVVIDENENQYIEEYVYEREIIKPISFDNVHFDQNKNFSLNGGVTK